MIHPWHDLPSGKDVPEEVLAVIEIPSRSRNKYELDKQSGLFRLDRLLYSAVHYPGDYGFIPRTLAEDGDPCDILVLTTEPTFSGCLIDARPIGLLTMLDRGEPDDKVLAVPAEDPFQNEFTEYTDLPSHTLREIAHFFEIYKDLEGKRVQVLSWENSRAAMDAVIQGVERYTASRGRKAGGTRRSRSPAASSRASRLPDAGRFSSGPNSTPADGGPPGQADGAL
jgi:inorganic pyrophosphatase